MDKNQIRLFSSRGSDDWATPPSLYDALNSEFRFTFDPCPLHPSFDGLATPWRGRVFCNPPYSQVRRWLEKAILELSSGRAEVVVFLVFANTDTAWFHDLIYHRSEIRFLRGRVKFIGPANHGAMRPSMLVIMRP